MGQIRKNTPSRGKTPWKNVPPHPSITEQAQLFAVIALWYSVPTQFPPHALTVKHLLQSAFSLSLRIRDSQGKSAGMESTPPPLHVPSSKEKKYDRQLRLWDASVQAALEDAHVLLVQAGPNTVGIEALKNLVLPSKSCPSSWDRTWQLIRGCAFRYWAVHHR